MTMPFRLSNLRIRATQGFTLTETMVVVAVSPVILGIIVFAMVSFQRTFTASEKMIRAQAAQARLIDHIATDLRRARKISSTKSPYSKPNDSLNTSTKFVNNPNYGDDDPGNMISIKDGTYDPKTDRVQSKNAPSYFLTVKIPGYYKSNVKSSDDYNVPNALTSSGDYIYYATSGASYATDITIQYRKAFLKAYNSECYIRRVVETGVDEVIADNANYIDLDIIALKNGTFRVDAWFLPSFSNISYEDGREGQLNSSDQVMLRNPRTD